MKDKPTSLKLAIPAASSRVLRQFLTSLPVVGFGSRFDFARLYLRGKPRSITLRSNKKKKIAVLASGTGTNLQAIIDSIKNGTLSNIEITIIISNKKDASALKRAEENNIKNIFLNPKDFKNSIEYDEKLVEIIKSYEIDLIVLAGFLRILTPVFINAFPNKIINIHPALLPNFGGKGLYGKKVHQAVLKSKVKKTGCTVHFVTNEIDGGPIITQKKVPIYKNDTVETLSNRVLQEEHKLLVEVIAKLLNTDVVHSS